MLMNLILIAALRDILSAAIAREESANLWRACEPTLHYTDGGEDGWEEHLLRQYHGR